MIDLHTFVDTNANFRSNELSCLKNFCLNFLFLSLYLLESPIPFPPIFIHIQGDLVQKIVKWQCLLRQKFASASTNICDMAVWWSHLKIGVEILDDLVVDR